jgi:positive regulator of sigma E activity
VIKLARILQIDTKKVDLYMEKNDSCGDCKSGCSESFLSFLFPKNTIISVSKDQDLMPYTHLNDSNGFFSQGYQKGDVVGIKFNENQLFKLALALYGLPILLIIISLVIFYYLFSLLNFNHDLGGITGLILGLVISKIVIKLNHNKFKPQVEFFK